MSAGESARVEAESSARRAQELRLAAEAEDRRARHFERGGAAEERVARLLGQLTAHDVHPLHDRRWPGTRSANIDHLVVGTSGVFVIDTKDWSGGVRVAADGLFRDQASCEEELQKVLRMADAVCQELVEEGLPPVHVVPVMAFASQCIAPMNVNGVWVMGADELPRFILLRGKLFTQLQVEQLLGRIMSTCLPAASAAIPVQPTVREVSTSAGEMADALIERSDLEAAALEAALRLPLADWMAYLHPAQAKLARRELNGPSRISGPAGTGKSVVALHRLAYLADRRRNKLLYVTFVKSVPRVLSHAYARLSPHTADRVEFASLHSWAFRFVRERGLLRRVDPKAIDAAFEDAWKAFGAGSLLERSADERYWREEVDRVIRGRCLHRLDDYLDLDRIGRGSRLGAQQRRAVWALNEAYETELRRRRLSDWTDVLRLARDEVRRRPPDPPYDVVILDEAQDMPLVAAELLNALAGDKPDGLMLVGDDQQRVFAGGFRLSEAGIDVSGRSTRLTKNYRNTREILQAARALVVDDDADLLEGGRNGTEPEVVRSGLAPIFVRALDRESHDAALIGQLNRLLEEPTSTPCEVAILVSARQQVYVYAQLLHRHGIASVALYDWDGVATNAVVVGTNKSAKGLEFKHVVVPGVDPLLMQATEPDDEYLAEIWHQRRRELYVAMTRARDSLWVATMARQEAGGRLASSGPQRPDDHGSQLLARITQQGRLPGSSNSRVG